MGASAGWRAISASTAANLAEYLTRMKRLAARFPGDSELICAAGFNAQGEGPYVLEAATRGVEIDPVP